MSVQGGDCFEGLFSNMQNKCLLGVKNSIKILKVYLNLRKITKGLKL